jgi:hypothetical protein
MVIGAAVELLARANHLGAAGSGCAVGARSLLDIELRTSSTSHVQRGAAVTTRSR